MPKLSVAEELDVGLKAAAGDADATETSFQVAERFLHDNRDLVAHFLDQWVLEKLAAVIAKHRRALRIKNDAQLAFESMLGFHRLPKRVPDGSGGTVQRADATVGLFRKLATALRQQQRDNPKLAEVNEAIALMSRYTAEKRRITWAEVVQLEAARKRHSKGVSR